MLMSLPISDSLRTDSLVSLTLPSHYGYCILVTVGSICVIKWKYCKVEKARITYNIPYPIMYSDEEYDFNCLQRAHQNILEHYPQFLALLLLGGLESPITSAIGGTIYLLGRLYYNGDPEKKNQMYLGEIGMLTMLTTTVKLALKLLQENALSTLGIYIIGNVEPAQTKKYAINSLYALLTAVGHITSTNN